MTTRMSTGVNLYLMRGLCLHWRCGAPFGVTRVRFGRIRNFGSSGNFGNLQFCHRCLALRCSGDDLQRWSPASPSAHRSTRGLFPTRAAGALRPGDRRRLGDRRRRHTGGHRRRRHPRREGSPASATCGRRPRRRRIDAAGLTVAPGFIDMHNHSDYTILRRAEGREHDPAGRHDDGAWRVAVGGPGEGRARRRSALARRRRGGRLDDARRLLREARAPAHGDQHRLVRRRGAGVDLRQGIRPVPGDAAELEDDEDAHRAGDGRGRDGPLDGAAACRRRAWRPPQT